MKTAALSLLLLATLLGPVLADSCGEELKKIDAALQSADLSPM